MMTVREMMMAMTTTCFSPALFLSFAFDRVMVL
jgi:hypothetical protein